MTTLRRRLDRMERQRAALMAELGGLSEAELGARPAPGKWSPLEVLEHLVRVEEAVLLGATRRPDSRSALEAARATARLTLLRLKLAAGVKIQVPSKLVLPQGTATLEELRARWDQARLKLEAVLADQTPADHRRPLMRHPLCGWLSTGQTLWFLERHVGHHGKAVGGRRTADGRRRTADGERSGLSS